jgi:hypothetical protein
MSSACAGARQASFDVEADGREHDQSAGGLPLPSFLINWAKLDGRGYSAVGEESDGTPREGAQQQQQQQQQERAGLHITRHELKGEFRRWGAHARHALLLLCMAARHAEAPASGAPPLLASALGALAAAQR